MLTDTAIRSAKPRTRPYKISDGAGLYLLISPTGAKLWRYRYRIAGKENVFAVGEYVSAPQAETSEQATARKAAGRFTAGEAREERLKARALVKQRLHPTDQRRLARIRGEHEHATTFRAVAEEWLASKTWSPRVLASRRKLLEKEIYPTIGDLPIRQVVPAHVLDVLKTVAARSAVTAAQARRTMSGVFELAISTLRADTDPVHPVRRAVKQPKPINKVALSRDQIRHLLAAIEVYSGQFETRTVFQLMWLTLARPSEVVEARWSEFDLDAALWRIPAERMKMDSAHTVPLPTQAVALLLRLKAITGHREVLFPHRDERSKPMSGAALRQAVRNMKLPFPYSPHATRTTGSTLLNEMRFRGEVIERQLAHQERDAVRRTYNHAEYLEERTQMMQHWADLLDQFAKGDGKVVSGKFQKAAA